MLKIALTGSPGAGKSTVGSLIVGQLATREVSAHLVKLAVPLYDVQRFFYARMGDTLSDGQQDGQLLNFVGGHYREAAPHFLIKDLDWRCDAARLAGAGAVVCDDARPIDLAALRDRGFQIVRVETVEGVRLARKRARGDRFIGKDDHPTEVGLEATVCDSDLFLENSGSMNDLSDSIFKLLNQFVAAPSGVNCDDLAGISPAVVELLERARKTIVNCYAVGRHQIAAALLTDDGRIFTGIHMEAMVGRASICAEAVALGKACEAGAPNVVLAAAFRHPKPTEVGDRIRLVPPCGLCRELLLDYGANAKVVLENKESIHTVSLQQLLPHKYVGTKWRATEPVS